MKRPVLWVLVFLICGIIAGAYGTVSLFVISVLAGLFLCAFLHSKYKYRPVFVFAVFMVLGIFRVGHSLHSYTTYTMYGVRLSGVAQDVGETMGGNQWVVVRMDNGIRFMVYIRAYQAWAQLGQQITVVGDLVPLTGVRNPGGYNQFQHLRSQKVDAVMWPERIYLGETRLTAAVLLRATRERLAAVYDELLPPREAAIIKSMVLGDRNELDRSLAEQYRGMGIFHILSISGLHVGILMMALHALLTMFWNDRRSGIIVLIVMVLYCLMTGASPATVRAVTMGGILIFGKILYRRYDLLSAVSLAGVILLMFEPLFLFNVGFQLSFVAVFGIGLLTAPVERLLTKLWLPKGRFRSGLAVNIAAVTSTYPVFAFHFYEIPIYSVIGNVIIAPTTSIILIAGVTMGLLGLAWATGAALIAGIVYYILQFYEIASYFFAGLPFSMLPTGGGNLLVAGLGAAVLLAFMYVFNGYNEDFKRRFVLLPVALTLLIISVFTWQNPRGVHITTLDTFGNHTVIRHRGDVLVIGSPRGGGDALLRYLDMQGINRANGLILTQPPQQQDADRLALLAERFDVIYISGDISGVLVSMTRFALSDLADAMYHNGSTMPQVVHLSHGDVRTAGRTRAQIYTQTMGRMGINIKLGDIAIAIEAEDSAANVHIVGYSMFTAGGALNIREHGAVRMRSNRHRITFYSASPVP